MSNNRFENFSNDDFLYKKSGDDHFLHDSELGPSEIEQYQLQNNWDLTGCMLVASPQLDNTPFGRSVVLVMQDNDEGTFGVVLNRPAEASVMRAWQDITGKEFHKDCVVQGGPVGGPVLAIHGYQSIAELEIPNGIFVSHKTDLIHKLSEAPDKNYRIVFGCARWGQGQLDQELEQGYWYPIVADVNSIFDEPEVMWKNSIRQYGQDLLCDVVGLQAFPVDSMWN